MVSTAELKAMSDVGDRIQIIDVPDVFSGKLVKEEVRVDTMGRQCLYMNIDIGGKAFTEKLTPMHLAELTKALAGMGLTDTNGLKDKLVEWHAKVFRIGNPRHLPFKFV